MPVSVRARVIAACARVLVIPRILGLQTPITAKLLNLLDLACLAKKTGAWTPTTRRIAERQMTAYSTSSHQPMLFRDSGQRSSRDKVLLGRAERYPLTV